MHNKNAYWFAGDQIRKKETNKQFSQHPTCIQVSPTNDENACDSVWVVRSIKH